MATEVKMNVDLARKTTLGVGGKAERFVEPSNYKELIEVLRREKPIDLWMLGFGSNTLISDSGLPGLTVAIKEGTIAVDGTLIIADSGVWWDDVVKTAVESGLWGIEMLSEVPGSVGGALHINIAAYGQNLGDVVEWIDVWDPRQHDVVRLKGSELPWAYKQSVFQTDAYKDVVILRCGLRLSPSPTTELTYEKALEAAKDIDADISTLAGRRAAVVEARSRAGSLWRKEDMQNQQTAGSFFRNPLVSKKQADAIIAHDESGLAADIIRKMNHVHGGNEARVSAAHVLLAAGYTRGQKISEHVRLHDKNVLKLETVPGATAREVYEAMTSIQKTVKDSLDIDLQPEVKLLGVF